MTKMNKGNVHSNDLNIFRYNGYFQVTHVCLEVNLIVSIGCRVVYTTEFYSKSVSIVFKSISDLI